MGISINYKKNQKEEAPSGVSSNDQERSHLDTLLLPHAHDLLAEWCEDTQISGHEISMRNPLRPDQHLGSFKFNSMTGAWSDFAAEGVAGYGITALFCYLKQIQPHEATIMLKELVEELPHAPAPDVIETKTKKPKVEAVKSEDVQLPPDLHPELGFPTMMWKYLDASNRVCFYVYRFDQDGKKETRPVAWSPEKNAWLWQYPPAPFPPYHFPDLLLRSSAVVIVTEGEKAADAAALQFPDSVVITSACGCDQANRTDWSALKGRNVIMAPDKDEPGKHYALSVVGAAMAHGASSVKVLDVWQMDDWSTGDDLADHTVTPDFLDNAVDASDIFEQNELEPHIVKAATFLGRGDFDRIRKSLAEHLGIGVRALGDMVKDARDKDTEDAEDEKVVELFEDDALESWPESVNGDALFDEIVSLINRHVILSRSQAVAVACWIIFSYGFETMRICPKLLINSPSKRCGKTTLLEIVMILVGRPLPAANISPAAVYRSIELWKPTLLIDEADTFLKNNEEITGILNSGHNRQFAFVIRTLEVDGAHTPVRFSTYCPQVIAMIKSPKDTIIDRSIVVTLTRKLTTQRIQALDIDAREHMKDTRRRLLRWIEDNLSSVKFDIEAVPDMENDRARQNWAVLAAFSQVLGEKAHASLLKASKELSDTSDIEESVEVDLLTDISEILSKVKDEYVQSAVLVKDLLKMKERPWGEINRGKELTENKLARLLKPFQITPDKYRDGMVTHRGYSKAEFQSIFDRYLKPVMKVAA